MNDGKKNAGQPDRTGETSLIERAAARLGRRYEEQVTAKTPAKANDTKVSEPPPPAEKPADAVQQPKQAESKRVTIDLAKLAAAGLVTPDGMHTPIGEEFRIIKRPLLLKALVGGKRAVKDANLIMVTSALPGEGKTYTALNLAMSMVSERDVFVLLVEADLSKPNILRALGLEEEKGFVDILDDDSLQISDVLLRTNIPNLSIIPSGRPHPMGTELLASDRAQNVVNEIAKRYANRIIIFDTAPILSSSQGKAFSRYVGQIVFVIEAEKSYEADVLAALNQLSSCENIGLVLNKERSVIKSLRHSGYKGYYYRHSSD
jgi:receptor protein-tyrosine kinase